MSNGFLELYNYFFYNLIYLQKPLKDVRYKATNPFFDILKKMFSDSYLSSKGTQNILSLFKQIITKLIFVLKN